MVLFSSWEALATSPCAFCAKPDIISLCVNQMNMGKKRKFLLNMIFY